jgi:hypothetical protein
MFDFIALLSRRLLWTDLPFHGFGRSVPLQRSGRSGQVRPMSQTQSRVVTKERPLLDGGKDFFLGRRPANRAAVQQTNLVHADGTIQPVVAHVHGSASALPKGRLQTALVEQYRREARVDQSHMNIKRHFETPFSGEPNDSSLSDIVEAVRPQVAHGPTTARAPARTAPRNQNPHSADRGEHSRPLTRAREITVDPSICPLGSGNRPLSLASAEPYRDTLRPMHNAKVLMESMQVARRGGVFRTLPSKGSLMVRNFYRRKHAPGELLEAIDDDAQRDQSPFIDQQEHAFLQLDETDANLWYVCRILSFGCACKHLLIAKV